MRKIGFPVFLLLIIFSLSSCALHKGSGREGQIGPQGYSAESPAMVLASSMDAIRLGDQIKGSEGLLFLRERYKGTTWAARASFVLGMRELKRGGERAIQYLREAEGLREIRPYVLLYLARAYVREKMFARAGQSYRTILVGYPDFAYQGQALYESALVLEKLGQSADALIALKAFIKQYPEGRKAGQALMKAARLETAGGNYASATEDIRAIIVNYPGKEPALQAALFLKENRRMRPVTLTKAESCVRATALFDSYFYSGAVRALKGLAAETPGACGGKAEPLLVETLFRMKRYGEAELILNKRLKRLSRHNNKNYYNERSALLLLATAYLRDGKDKAGVFLDTVKSLSKKFPGSAEARSAVFMEGAFYESAGRRKRAIEIYGRILRDGAEPSATAAWHRGWLEFTMGRYLEAYKTLNLSSERLNAGNRLKFAYWRGRALDKAGQKARAMAEYQKACEGGMPGYYCYMAKRRLGLPIGGPWSAKSVWGDRVVRPAPLTAEGLEEGNLRAAMVLLSTGLTKEAAFEADRALQGQGHAPERNLILSLMRAFYDAGDYYHAIKVYDSYFGLLMRHNDTIRPELLRVAFPMKVVEYISAKGLAGEADPLLVAAVMREESSYDPDTISRTGAVGLMQVMPSTAEFIARASGRGHLTAEALLDPETNISLGAWYLAYLWRKTKGDPVETIAGYNAGLNSVLQWRKRYPQEDDEFIESIPFRETRNYTKKVLKSYQAFKMLAAGRRPLLAYDGVGEKGLAE